MLFTFQVWSSCLGDDICADWPENVHGYYSSTSSRLRVHQHRRDVQCGRHGKAGQSSFTSLRDPCNERNGGIERSSLSAAFLRGPTIGTVSLSHRFGKQCTFQTWHEAFLCLWERSKSGSECSPQLEIPPDSALERNDAYEVNFQTVYLLIDLIFPIRGSLHFSFFRLSPIVLICTPRWCR